METLGKVLLVCLIVVCVLLVLLVIIQDDGENGMGGLLGGRGTAAFGSHSANVLTKTTAVLVFLFFGLSVGLAVLNKKPTNASLIDDAKVEELKAPEEEAAPADWWNKSEAESATEEVSADTVQIEEAETASE